MANQRTGSCGVYYGSYYSESEPLTQTEMNANAKYIYSYLTAKGWTINAISGILGNMTAESSLNPGRWQSDDVGNTSLGYGLVQWTPATNYLNWCESNNLSDPSEMDNALSRIIYELENSLQYYATSDYPLSFEEFSTSTASVSYLAEAFLINYERPADQSDSVKAYRSSLAANWHEYLSGSTPSVPSGPSEIELKRRRYNFLILNSQRRKNTWQWKKRRF